MAAVTPRFLHDNLAILAATVIDASSEVSTLPPGRLRLATPTDVWRSKTGWNIVAGFNDKMDFNFNAGGADVATLTAGNYATGALMAAQIVTALEAADSAPVWTCTYDSGTKLFTIGADGNFVLLFLTGANLAASVGPDLGYDVEDTASGTSAVADDAVYKSREWIRFDLGAAAAYTSGYVLGHNLGASHTVKLLGKSASDVWDTPGNSQTLAGDDLANKRILFFASQSYRYLLVLFEDQGNSAGFTEAGVVFAGTYDQLARGVEPGAVRRGVLLAPMVRGLGGAIFKETRNNPKTLTQSFRYLTRADVDTYQAMEDSVVGKHMLLAADPQNYPGKDSHYGAIAEPAEIMHEPNSADPPLYRISIIFAEDLG